LQARLYGETVGRIYRQTTSDTTIFLLLAHGDVQSNELQLHRPEVCFPAFGFEILSNAADEIALEKKIAIPARQIVAKSFDQQQTIIYWTRLGEYFPIDGAEQRLDRLEIALKGVIADGLLARFSIADTDPATARSVLDEFIPALVRAVSATRRRALIGSERANALAGQLR
jgi:EpsI family protein